MRILLSTIGSRGDVQPLIALGQELQRRGADVRLCAPPDFRELAAAYELAFVPVGPPLQKGPARPAAKPTFDDLKKLISGTVASQFSSLRDAVADCDAIVACNQIQVAARSIAEWRGIPYWFADYSPISFPSDQHLPPRLPGQRPEVTDPVEAWREEIERRNATWLAPLNEHRAALGLPAADDVLAHILGDEPWLAADRALAPWPESSTPRVQQTGAWMVDDPRPLSAELQRFLSTGEPPMYFGYGSMSYAKTGASDLLQAARAVSRRAIISRGWGELTLAERADDCLLIDETNLAALFPHVAAAVHHGGAGTTTTAARAGIPQVVVPHMYDQHYFAGRVDQCGIGVQLETPTAGSLAQALERVLQPELAQRARSFAARVQTDGADAAARRVVARA